MAEIDNNPFQPPLSVDAANSQRPWWVYRTGAVLLLGPCMVFFLFFPAFWSGVLVGLLAVGLLHACLKLTQYQLADPEPIPGLDQFLTVISSQGTIIGCLTFALLTYALVLGSIHAALSRPLLPRDHLVTYTVGAMAGAGVFVGLFLWSLRPRFKRFSKPAT